MKNIHTNFMAKYILKLTGEYASANRIHDVLNLSLSFTYFEHLHQILYASELS